MGARVLSGSFAGQSVVVTDASGAFVIPGVSVVAGKRALILLASAGPFFETGEPATLVVAHKLSAAYGSLSETGFASTAALVGPVSFGAFSLIGEPATLHGPAQIAASCGGFSMTGEPATFSRSHRLALEYGSFALTGEPIAFPSAPAILGSEFGSFSLTGGLSTGASVLPAGFGSISLTGKPAGFGVEVRCAFSAFYLTGGAADLRVPAIMDAFPAGFSLFGKDSTAALVEPIGFGSITLTGSLARAGLGLPCVAGSIALTGKASLRHFSVMFPGGALALTGAASSAALVEPIVDFGALHFSGGQSWRWMDSLCFPGEIGVHGKTSFREFGGLSGFEEFDFTDGASRLAYGRALSAATGDFSTAGEASTLLHNRTMALMAGSLSLFGQVSANNVGRLGGAPGLGKVRWSRAAAPRVNWIS